MLLNKQCRQLERFYVYCTLQFRFQRRARWRTALTHLVCRMLTELPSRIDSCSQGAAQSPLRNPSKGRYTGKEIYPADNELCSNTDMSQFFRTEDCLHTYCLDTHCQFWELQRAIYIKTFTLPTLYLVIVFLSCST